MEAKLQRRIQRYGWDKAASYYEPYWKHQLWPAQDRLLALANLDACEQVLDVACGTGLVTFPAAAQVGPGGSVFATDLSDRMVETIQAEAERRQVGQVRAERMDAEDLQISDISFDAVLCALGLMYVPDPLQAVREMHRVLRPGGRAVATVWGQRQQCGWADIFPIVDARVNTDVCPLFFQLGTGTLLQQTFETAGFTDVTTERINTPLYFDSAEAACSAAFIGGPVALAYARFDEPTRAEAQAEYLASIEPYREGKGYAIPGEFVVVRGVKH